MRRAVSSSTTCGDTKTDAWDLQLPAGLSNTCFMLRFLLSPLPLHLGEPLDFVQLSVSALLPALWYIDRVVAAAPRRLCHRAFPANDSWLAPIHAPNSVTQYLDFELRSWLRSRYFEWDEIDIERRSDRSRSRSLDLLFLRCLLLWCLFGVRLRDRDRPIFAYGFICGIMINFDYNFIATMPNTVHTARLRRTRPISRTISNANCKFSHRWATIALNVGTKNKMYAGSHSSLTAETINQKRIRSVGIGWSFDGRGWQQCCRFKTFLWFDVSRSISDDFSQWPANSWMFSILGEFLSIYSKIFHYFVPRMAKAALADEKEYTFAVNANCHSDSNVPDAQFSVNGSNNKRWCERDGARLEQFSKTFLTSAGGCRSFRLE